MIFNKSDFKFKVQLPLVFLAIIYTTFFSQAQQMFYHLLGSAVDPYAWVGLGVDANWNTPANWAGNQVPGNTNIAIFDENCLSNCDPTMNIAINVGGVNIKSTYAGTITQTNTITIGSGGWTQRAGTFIPSAHAITMSGAFALSGGTYTATNQTWTQTGNFSVTGGVFNHNAGTIVFNDSNTINPGAPTYNNISFVSVARTHSLSAGTMIVEGQLIINGTHGTTPGSINSGTIEARQNVTVIGNGYGGTAVIKFNGTGAQTFTGVPTGWVGAVEINKPSDTLTLSGTIRSLGNWTWVAGTVNAAGTTLSFEENSTITPGTIQYNNVSFTGVFKTFSLNSSTLYVLGTLNLNDTHGSSSGPINSGIIEARGDVLISNQGKTGSALIKINGTGAQSLTGSAVGWISHVEIDKSVGTLTMSGTIRSNGNWTWTSGTVDSGTSTLSFEQTSTITPGAFNYYNVSFVGDHRIFGLNAGTMNVINSLVFSDLNVSGGGVNNGTINAAGNVTFSNNGKTGTAVLNYVGNTNTTLTIAAAAHTLTTTHNIAKTGLTTSVSLTANASFASVGRNFTITSGTFNVAGFTFSVNSLLTISNGGRLLCNGGTATAGSWTITGEISCGSGQGITWTGNAGDNLWSTAGNWTNNNIPGAADLALFNSSCAGANCNANIDVAASVRGLNLVAAYPGILTQQAGRTIAIAGAGYTQAGGTFAGGDSAVTSSGAYLLSGGNFTSTSSTWTQSAAWSITNSPTFNHNNGTINFSAGITIIPNTVNYFGVGFTGNGSNYNLSAGTMTVLGLLTINNGVACCGSSQITNGTISAKGDISLLTSSGGSAWIRVTGSGNQTITGAFNGIVSNFQFNSTGGTVSVVGTLSIGGNYTYTAGVVDWGTSVLRFRSSTTIIPGNIDYKDVYFGEFTGATHNLSAGTMKVLGTLTIDSGVGCCGTSLLNNGTIEASGNISLLTSSGGSALVKLVGTTNQTVTGVSSAPLPAFEIASTGGTVTFVGTVRVGGPTFRYTSGVVDFGTSTLQFFNSITITPGNLIYGNVVLGLGVSNPIIDLNAGTMIVNGTLTTDMGNGCCGYSQITNGTIEAKGNVNFGGGSAGSALVKISGTGNQTITGINSGSLPNVQFISTGGTVTLSGTFNFGGTFTYTSGTIDPGTSTVRFVNTQTIAPNSITLNNVTFTGASTVQNLSGQVLNVNGVLTIDDTGVGQLNNGTVNASGNVDFTNNGKSGTAVLNFAGGSTSTLSSTTTATLLTTVHNVAKTGGSSLNLATDMAYSAVGRNLTVSSGVLNLNANDLAINNILTVAVGATVRCSGGALTYGSLANSGTMNCPGFSTYDFNWTGAGGNTNWDTAGNWQGGTAPAVTDVAFFDPTYCGATCDAIFNVNPNLRGIITSATYTGTITQPPGITATIGRLGWNHQNGIFNGGNSNLTITGGLTVAAGTFNLPTATTTLGEVRCGTRNILIFTGGTLSHNNGRLKIAHQRIGSCNSVANLSFPNGFTLYDFETEGQIGAGWYNTTNSLNGTLLNVLNNFYDYGHQLDFDIDLQGHLYVNRTDRYSTTRHIRFMGAGNQEFSFTPGSQITSKIKIEKTSGTVQPAAGITELGAIAFELAQGSFTPPSLFKLGTPHNGSITINLFTVANGQTYNIGTGTTQFALTRLGTGNSTSTINVPVGFNFYNLIIEGNLTGGGWNSYYNSATTLNVVNNFTHNGSILNANVAVQGNVIIGPNAEGGSGTTTLNGAGAQSLTAYPGSIPATGTWTVNKASGTVSMFGSGLALSTTGQDFDLLAGTIDLNEAVLNVKDQFNISPGATVICSNGFYTAGTLNNSGTISCSGNSYVKAVLSDNPKAYYRFGEPSSAYKIGSSAAGNAYVGSTINPADVTFGVNRISASFTDKSVTTSNNGVFDFATSIPLAASYTLEAWFKTAQPNNGSGWNTLFRNGGSSPTGNHHVITQVSNTNIGIYDNLGGTTFRTSGFAISTAPPGWQHLVVTGSGTTTTFFINGVNVGTVPIKSTQSISQIGNYLTGGQAFGNIDDVAIYDSVLSQGQIDAHYAAGAPATANVVYMEDALPAGAVPFVNNDAWTWVAANPTPNTGTLAHKSNLVAGMHQHYFDSATAFPIYLKDTFYIDVYLDPVNPPTEIMIQLNDGTGWEHRVFWGADSLAWGTLGTNSRRYKGVLPATGTWVRLTFTAAEVGMVGLNLRGVAFSLFDGRVTWDQLGVIR